MRIAAAVIAPLVTAATVTVVVAGSSPAQTLSADDVLYAAAVSG